MVFPRSMSKSVATALASYLTTAGFVEWDMEVLGLRHPHLMRLPYYIGCPSWSENAWREYLYPADARSGDYLALYSQVFNAVEGNTTFYARPRPPRAALGRNHARVDFASTAKFPRRYQPWWRPVRAVAGGAKLRRPDEPVGERVAPLWLQLSASFSPQRLGELAGFIDGLERPLAVEVRHLEFFAKGDAERCSPSRCATGVERVCLDPRALFSCTSTSAAVRAACSIEKSPRSRHVRRR